MSLFCAPDSKLLFFQKFSTFHMQGLIYLTASSGLPTTGLTVTGDLIMVQKQPLAHKGFDDRFSKPIFNKTSIFADVFRFDRIIHEYSQQNGKISQIELHALNQVVLYNSELEAF